MSSYSKSSKKMVTAALLIACGILVVLIMPFKIIIGPASVTLGSHVAINLAMMISPGVAFMVALGTTIGFQLAGFPIVIVARALSQVIYATIGSYLLKKHLFKLTKTSSRLLFSFIVNLIHALGEVVAVYLLTNTGNNGPEFWWTLVVMIGCVTLVHGMVDMEIAYQLARALVKRTSITFDLFD